MNKNTLLQKSQQVKKNTKVNPKRLLKWQQSDITPKVDPVVFFTQHATKVQKRAFNYLAGLSNTYRDIYPAQGGALSKYADCTREAINRSIRILGENGFISKYRRYNDTCFYRISPLFKDMGLRKKLSHILSAFKYLPLALLIPLVSFEKPVIASKITPKQRDIYINKKLRRERGILDVKSPEKMHLHVHHQILRKKNREKRKMKRSYMGSHAYKKYQKVEPPGRNAQSKNYGYSPYDRVRPLAKPPEPQDELSILIRDFRKLKQNLVKSYGTRNEFLKQMRQGWRDDLTEIATQIDNYDPEIVPKLMKEDNTE